MNNDVLHDSEIVRVRDVFENVVYQKSVKIHIELGLNYRTSSLDKNSRSTYSYLTSCLARLDIQILCHHQYQMKLCTTNKPLGFQSTVPGT